MSAYIDDGYTIPSVIPAREGLHEKVSFEFRPATAREYRKWLEERNRGIPDNEPTADAKYLANHVVKWDIKSKRTGDVPLTPQSCDRLHPDVQSAMLNQISGDAAPGVDVEAAKGN